VKVLIAEIAREEFYAAKEYYEFEQVGLGLGFEKEIKSLFFAFRNILPHGLLNVMKFDITLFINSLLKYYIQSKIT
jgi:hypothetical protein